MYYRYRKKISIFLQIATFFSFSITAYSFNGNPDIKEYIGESLEHVVQSLQDKSIQINWASSIEQFQVLSYNSRLDLVGNPCQDIFIKCFFRKKTCFGKVIIVPCIVDTSEVGGLLESDEDSSRYTFHAEIEISEGKSTIYVYLINKNPLIKKLNQSPLTVKPVEQVIREASTINRYFWGSLQVGFPYYSSVLNNSGVSASFSSDRTHFLYIIQYKKTSYDNAPIIYDINEISYLSAYLLSEGKLRMTFCAGLSYLFWDETFIDNSSNESSSRNTGLGVPVEAQYYLRFNSYVGMGISLRANINGSKTFYQFGALLLFGKIR